MPATVAGLLTFLALTIQGTTAKKCSKAFDKISAADWISSSNPGWNLGNTLDAIPTEGSWNNPPVQAKTFSQIKKAGFHGMRLPITWYDHFVSEGPEWTVNATWLQRVSHVVDESISRGFYTIVNVHHDATDWLDVTAPGANYTEIEEKFYRLWFQIGTKLGCKSSLLAFETMNEPPGTTQAQFDEINKLNGIFLEAINDAGGHNPDRVVTLVGPGEDGAKTSLYFKKPANVTNPWAIQVRVIK
jgi:endoglucanase